VKHAITFANVASRRSVHLPEGAKGDMCRAVQNDVEFARWFLTGPNPVMIRRCSHIPTDKLPVTDEMMSGLLDRTGRLADEAQVISRVSVVDSIYWHPDVSHEHILPHCYPGQLFFPFYTA